MVSSLICDRWLTCKLTMFMGSTDSWECQIQQHDARLQLWGWTYSEPARRGWWSSLRSAGLDLQRTCEKGLVGRHCSAYWARHAVQYLCTP